MITIIDYGVGNTLAFANVFSRMNIPYIVAKEVSELKGAEKFILPGVGSFDHAMNAFSESGMRDVVEYEVLEKETPILGICVGMQMLATYSDEGNASGLNWIPGQVKKFDFGETETLQVPHMGWNEINAEDKGELFYGMPKAPAFYFLHSYYYKPTDMTTSYATADYGNVFTVAVRKKNIFGVQFHPEKSHSNGHLLLKNFAEI